ncbi:heavy metal translocating P-type ATPase [Saccharomonospora xinjiangensis]|uniref:Heavy metal translocating P-type ATPase n=1 Tax=Saccharomonospora xinjiangensis XJ-54 TaxID=882086 RepID=I0V7M5_9PSEU|nr:heavy metal translocating P-type ATPase [Saccharomonospora xinjiangensis]EID56128.1 heavy metal translocating P-type ATPase [Saccharomonospora xinjiangensis XJ-54]
MWRAAWVSRHVWVLVGVSVLLVAGFAAWPLDGGAERWLWAAATAGALVPSVARVVADLRRRRYGADLLAVLALVGTLAVGEYLAGAVVALMVATGQVLEAAAAKRAARDLSGLLTRAPHHAHRRTDGELVTVPVEEVAVGDELVVLPGEIVPVDGVLRGEGVFDESALTGEPEPVVRPKGDRLRSGTVNAGAAVDLATAATVADSTYAGIIRLAEQAAAERAPIARLADRVAGWFLPLALVIAGVAWLAAGDAVTAVAVLVTATPCPLLLAVPIAVTGGMSRTSRAGIVVRDGAALELLGHTTTLLLDKTGTVTQGRPEITDVVCAPGITATDALRLAASVEQYSPHVLAAAVLRAADRAGVKAGAAEEVTEIPGRAAQGRVGGRTVRVGRMPPGTAIPEWAAAVRRRGRLDLATVIWVTVDGELSGALLGRDRIRADAARTMRRLHAEGVKRVVLLTGDRVDSSAEVASMLGLDEVQAEATPEDKIARVRRESGEGVVVMVGDGINDAPALAAADVGIALGSRGSTAAVQAADAVIVDDRIDRLADSMEIARRTRRVAAQSGVIGTVLSLTAMIAAALGWLVPVAGAVVQEGIDVAVILNSLRVLRAGRRRAHPEADALLRRFAGEHESLEPVRASVRHAADSLSAGATPEADAAVRRAYRLLVDELLPHENAEEAELYPVLGGVFGSTEPTVTMSRGHAEIARLCRRLGRHLDTSPDGIVTEQIDDLRATLYGLDAVLTLHFAQEEEGYFTLSKGD